MNILKSHFWYPKSHRNGILFLTLLIVLFQIYLFFTNNSTSLENESNDHEYTALQFKIDSLSKLEKESVAWKTYPFNPNYISDFKGYQLGMSVEEIDRLFAFRKKNNFVHTAKEFQHITGISDSLLNQIAPFFKFPKWTQTKKKETHNSSPKTKLYNHTARTSDLNEANLKDLMTIQGVGEKLGKRILAYRKKLGGYLIDDQLYEVYYLDPKVGDAVLRNFSIIEVPRIEKVNLNEASFKEILRLPYIDYELTKKICNYRDEVLQFTSLEELKKIDSFPLEKFERIALYLTAD